MGLGRGSFATCIVRKLTSHTTPRPITRPCCLWARPCAKSPHQRATVNFVASSLRPRKKSSRHLTQQPIGTTRKFLKRVGSGDCDSCRPGNSCGPLHAAGHHGERYVGRAATRPAAPVVESRKLTQLEDHIVRENPDKSILQRTPWQEKSPL